MQNSFTIKGITIGEGRPVICVPVVAADDASVIGKIIELSMKHVQMIEWRVDCFGGVNEPARVASVLEAVKPYLEKTILLFTFRSLHQGGAIALEEKKIMELNTIAAKSGAVDIVDVEFFECTKPAKEIPRLQRLGVKIIASHHDFHTTPRDEVLRILLEQMQQGGADIAKLAVMPENKSDVIRLLKATSDIKVKYPTLPVVTMSMGALGVISRICGETFGSCITFGASGQVSAPGQLQMDDLAQLLDTLHESMSVKQEK